MVNVLEPLLFLSALSAWPKLAGLMPRPLSSDFKLLGTAARPGGEVETSEDDGREEEEEAAVDEVESSAAAR